jgi:hypothetical protein
MADDPWLKEFRALHERARKGKLSGEETELYQGARETLARTLSKVQGLTLTPGQTARQFFRVALAMPLELQLPDGPLKCITMDVGRGGFSSSLQHLPEGANASFGFSIKLPGGVMPVVGRARVVDYRKQTGNYRVSFAFVDLNESDQDRIERALFDSVLARLG